MKKNTLLLLTAVMSLTVFAGCAGGTKNSTASVETAENDTQSYADADTETAEAENGENAVDAQAGDGAASFDWLPAGVEQQKAETEPNEELQQLIAEYYEIPDYELADSRYYYNYVDLDSGLAVKQAFTLVNMPVIVVDNEEGGPKDLILERSGGGAETEYVRLTCTDGVYTNVSDAETVSDLEDVQGVAVLCNDLAEDMQSGNYLTLE